MPELPEVETIARGVDMLLRGGRIKQFRFGPKPEPFKTSPEEMAEVLPGATIQCVHRSGKHIVFKLTTVPSAHSSRAGGPRNHDSRTNAHRLNRAGSRSGEWIEWIVHLGMTGRLLVSDPDVPLPPHTHCVLSLASGRELRFVDPRRFGRIQLLRSEKLDGHFISTGREPLQIGVKEFAALFHGRQTSIKAALLNQKILAGVGNIYADESLFRAGIRPQRRASRLTGVELERLRQGLRNVLRKAISLGGSSVSDYVDASGEKGLFQFEHMVYRRTGKPCRVCGTPIRRIRIAQRSTHFCPTCQR